ncbi:hypothetical protein [Pannonibacter phragmitetus]|uniref:Sulfatase n=1 Tax=Pannonibacter phragmitetus TaxID=121719 RepID=A0A0U3N4P3_9HYPH|nr:hypothetical protein [Pannonibacter phragmitetus]ALV27864.1 sulfatase [Pannonibacter phragmitetus]
MTGHRWSGKTPKARDGQDDGGSAAYLKPVVALAVFLVVFIMSCNLPVRPGGYTLAAFARLPFELPLAGLALLLLPRWLAYVAAALVTLLVFVLLFLKLADTGVQMAFQRPFNPYLDIRMLGDGWNLLSGTIGTFTAALAVALALALLAGVMGAFFWSAVCLIRMRAPLRLPALAAFAILLAGGLAMLAASGNAGFQSASLGERLKVVARSIADLSAFEAELVQPADLPEPEQLFARVRGRDVVLAFIESYGRSAIEDPRYAPLTGPRLAAVQAELEGAGYAMASGWTRAPTVGGLSWLAHGTLLSGLWVDSQARYDLLMRSDRPSLNRMFRDAGWQSVAVMPAITMDWPESAYYGYDTVLAAKDLGYTGKPFNWVTMPDQYTLSAFDRLARLPAAAEGKPVMAEIALISSHAPWTPVPSLIDWDEAAEGSNFNAQAESGDSPAVVWADPERVRDHYIRTIDYALETLGSYIARSDGEALYVFLGDHQPAAIITGQGASRAVPVHVVSRDRALVSRFLEHGFTPGMTPAATPQAGQEPGMDGLRDVLIRTMSGE